jgi:hypothetical protein
MIAAAGKREFGRKKCKHGYRGKSRNAKLRAKQGLLAFMGLAEWATGLRRKCRAAIIRRGTGGKGADR